MAVCPIRCSLQEGVDIQPKENHIASFIGLRMASFFTSQASSFPELLHVLAGGLFYSLLTWKSMWHAKPDCFSGLGLVRSSLKVSSSSKGPQTGYFSLFVQFSWGAHIIPVNGFPAWKWSKTHSQFSISHANGGSSGAEDPKQQIIWKSLLLALEQRQWCGIYKSVYTQPCPVTAWLPWAALVFIITDIMIFESESDKGEKDGVKVFHSERPWKEWEPLL